ncbi:hypothetical protein BDZ89DRAFT_1073852 [Hymenopellis radicata]|nr:hypothetical protein BDZ89DRAFT_1073852 [Hymenopellis radicata]
MANGTLFVVTDDPSVFPQKRMMISTGLPGFDTDKNRAEREPTDRDLLTYRALKQRNDGELAGVLINEPSQFLGHYYHFVAELFFGIQAFWHGSFSTASNRARTDADGWRDKPGLNAYFLHAAFPSLAVEDERDWQERINATWPGPGSVDQVWHFPTLLLTDRSASFRSSIVGLVTNRIASAPLLYMQERNLLMGVQAGGWWEPVHGVEVKRSDMVQLPLPEKVVITYVSRQATSSRRFTHEHHAVVLQALEGLARRKGWEFNELRADMSREKQIQVAARTTVLVGIHGNGLSHLVFMPPTKASAVVEIFNPPGFAHDYEWTARALGMTHYAIHYDRVMTYPNEPQYADMGASFHSDAIRVDPGTVVKTIEDHVAKKMM